MGQGVADAKYRMPRGAVSVVEANRIMKRFNRSDVPDSGCGDGFPTDASTIYGNKRGILVGMAVVAKVARRCPSGLDPCLGAGSKMGLLFL